MTAAAMVVLGAGVGVGVLLVRRGVTQRTPTVAALLAGLDRPGTPLGSRGPDVDPATERVLNRALTIVEALGHDPSRLHQELELAERAPARHAFDKLLAALAGLLVPNLAVVGLLLLGINMPVGVIAVFSLVTCAAGFVLPDLALREEAERRRTAFRHALSSYLDLVNILLAGGAGIETALYAAADAGDGWGYRTIRNELRRARLTGRSPWDTFGQLADRLGVTELAELAASISLAGSHGARIRASLAAKADTLRGHQIAETEASAEAATERMTIPVAVLLFGFLVFIAYPAIAQITSVSGPQP